MYRESFRNGLFFCVGLIFLGATGASAQGFAAADAQRPAPATPTDSFASALHQTLGGAEASAFYQARGDAPLWLADGGERAVALVAALREADTHALPTGRYRPDRLDDALARVRAQGAMADPAELARLEAALSETYLRYARDLTSGVLEPRRVASEIKVAPPRPEVGALLRAAASAPDMAAHLAMLQPADPDYAALRSHYLRALASLDRSAAIPAGPTLRVGDVDPRVTAVRRRLADLGLAAASDAGEPARFDAALAEAVSRFQGRHGLNRDGVVGPATLAALNESAQFRAGQLAVNLERLRWMNRPLGERRIVVNQADYTVRLIDGDDVLFDERVVVGKLANQTPEFSDEMEYLVLNPTWHLPRSIATKELLPQLQQDPTVLARRGMRLVRTDGGPMPEDVASHDFSTYDTRTFPYSVRQAPSLDNALGLVKFMFPNADAIYLHDTPTKKYFARDVRALSHGCVRVQDPLRLATLLLSAQRPDAATFIDEVLRTGRERYVYLDQPVPVHLTYRTAWVDGDGVLQLRADVYGRDRRTLAALEAAGVAAPGA